MLKPTEKFNLQRDEALQNIALPRMPLQQVLHNLVNNAIKHHDKPEGHVHISVEEKDGTYVFAVTDDGPGIEEKFFKQIFEMFRTLKPRDEVEGSGMGLALVKKIVEEQGGEIWLESTIGEGTTFYFSWPRPSLPTPPVHQEKDPTHDQPHA